MSELVVCSRPGCQTSAGCQCNNNLYVVSYPRTMAVNMPFPNYGVTIAIMDSEGNVTIKVHQPRPEAT